MVEQLEDLVGAKLVIGFPGTKVTPDVVQQFRDTHAGGVIFYRINFESPEQIRRVITDLENALQRRLLVCVDHEGGRVIMYRDGVTIFPDNLAFGNAGRVEYARQAGAITAKELRALGTDINFSPCLDVLTETYSPNIGIRSFGRDWKVVRDMGVAYIKALQDGGVSACAKHFPGLGHAPMDPHLQLPTIMSTWDEMQKIHLQPFVSTIEAGVDVIMSSHPRYPKLDPANIVSFSRRIMTDCLRDELGYKGLICSDDLEMGAITEICPIDIAAVKTVAAGHDLILSCHNFESERKCFEGLLDAYKGRLLPLNELEESVSRIETLKAKRPNRFEGSVGPAPKGPPLARQVAGEGTVVIQDNENLLPLSAALRQDVAIVFPQLSSFAQKIMVEKPFEDEPGYFRNILKNVSGKHTTYVYKIDPDDQDLEKATVLAQKSAVTIFYCYDAHLQPKEQPLLAKLQQSARKLIVVLLRDPYDKEFLKPKTTALTAFGWRQCQIEATTERIYGGLL